VAKVEFHPGELFPRVGFIVTNRTPLSVAGAAHDKACHTAVCIWRGLLVEGSVPEVALARNA
jgi:hypothetical protein